MKNCLVGLPLCNVVKFDGQKFLLLVKRILKSGSDKILLNFDLNIIDELLNIYNTSGPEAFCKNINARTSPKALDDAISDSKLGYKWHVVCPLNDRQISEAVKNALKISLFKYASQLYILSDDLTRDVDREEIIKLVSLFPNIITSEVFLEAVNYAREIYKKNNGKDIPVFLRLNGESEIEKAG